MGEDFDHEHLATSALRVGVDLDIQIRLRHDLPIRTVGREVLLQLVSDGEAELGICFVEADDEIAGKAAVGQIVGKGTNGLPEFVHVGCGAGALDAEGLARGN